VVALVTGLATTASGWGTGGIAATTVVFVTVVVVIAAGVVDASARAGSTTPVAAAGLAGTGCSALGFVGTLATSVDEPKSWSPKNKKATTGKAITIATMTNRTVRFSGLRLTLLLPMGRPASTLAADLACRGVAMGIGDAAGVDVGRERSALKVGSMGTCALAAGAGSGTSILRDV